MITGNKGEWSEQYVMYHLLSSGFLKGSNKKLEPTGTNMPVLKIIRIEEESITQYVIDEDIKIIKNEEIIDIFPKSEFENNADYLKKAIKDKEGIIPKGGSFAIPVTEEFMKKIHCEKLKSKSSDKRDITLEIHDILTGVDLIEGFSIKSYLGANPTLINPSNSTKFRYEIKNCNDTIMNNANNIKGDYIGRINYLENSGCNLAFVNTNDEQFNRNLCMIDGRLIDILQGMLIRSFTGKCKSIKEMVEWYESTDPLKINIPGYYKYKMKQILSACALGMKPSTPWTGDEDSNGGFIVVKQNGDIVCFFIYDRKELYDYLIECTVFETPSSSKYGYYIDIRKENDEKYYLDLCLQIRFVEPGHKFKKCN